MVLANSWLELCRRIFHAYGMQGSHTTSRHVSYALGYTALGMLNEASEELEAIGFEDRFSPEVLSARIELHLAARHWDVLVGLGRRYAADCPGEFRGWFAWATALNKLGRVSEARDVLIEAEPCFGELSGLLHFNLACYECALGNMSAARERLGQACKLDKKWKKAALDDPDLQPIWGDVRTLK